MLGLAAISHWKRVAAVTFDFWVAMQVINYPSETLMVSHKKKSTLHYCELSIKTLKQPHSTLSVHRVGAIEVRYRLPGRCTPSLKLARRSGEG